MDTDVVASTELAALAAAAATLARGDVVLHATEGVWGLAADAQNQAAVEKILAIKQRDRAQGLIVIADDAAAFAQELSKIAAAEVARIKATWPGSVTWILPNVRFAAWVTGEHPTVACRVPGHAQARALCAAFGAPLVSTSANVAGQPAHTDGDTADRQFGHQVGLVLAGATLDPGKASEIRTLDGRVLRRS